MRIIKFRARKENGEWVVGNFIHHFATYFNNEERYSIFLPTPENGHGGFWIEFIENDTVGQFTGLVDKNDKEIYEGDIVKWSNGRMYVVKFWQGMFYASVKECNNGFLGGFPLHALTDYEEGKCEIIGNIFDNPELLKGGEK